MDKNTITGFVLIFILVLVYGQLTKPSPEQLAEMRMQDSLEQIRQLEEENPQIANLEGTGSTTDNAPVYSENDSIRLQQLSGDFGPFAASASGTEQLEVLENEFVKVTFSNKGGKVKEVLLKEYFKIHTDENKVESKVELKLMEDEKNHFEYLFPMANVPTGMISSEDLYFKSTINGNTIRFKANMLNGGYLEQVFTLLPGTYEMDYQLNMVGLDKVLARGSNEVKLNWITYADKLEKNTTYERNYTTVYFKAGEDDPTYCSCTSDGEEDADGGSLKWVSHSNQFFNTTLIAANSFTNGKMETKVLEVEDEDLKLLKSELNIPFQGGGSESFAMKMYMGPNEYDRLAAIGSDFQEIIPYGRSIFGTVNRWIIKPMFDFLSQFIGSMGIVILVLTFIVKMVLYPLYYKMLYSQSKMGALKPRLAVLKEKHGDDAQAVQVETMKLYREFGVSPLGGCMPMVLQMPIWFALYRFFPASIEFRQASFLWATDLSSFDVAFNLPFEIPFYGAHVSLFTLLWAASTVAYTYYNTKHMDMSMNPMMKNMQYMMPVMFLFFFNNFAAGLTCYMLFSNLLNILQTVVTKEYIIDKKKIEEELEAYKKKPKKKKKGGFQDRLEAAMKEQKKQAAEKEASKKKKKK